MIFFKFNGFVALILVAILVGLLEGMPLNTVMESISDGIGGQLNDLVLILGFGAMLGKVMADRGAAQRISNTLIDRLGIKRGQIVVLILSFILGVTMCYEVAFVLLFAIVFTIVRRTTLKLFYFGLVMSIGLSTTHC